MPKPNSLHDLIHLLDQALENDRATDVKLLGTVINSLRSHLHRANEVDDSRQFETDRLRNQVRALCENLECRPVSQITREAHGLHRALSCYAANFAGCNS